MRFQSVSELAAEVAKDEVLANTIAADPAKALADVAGALQSDVMVYRIVVSSLGAAVVSAVIGAIVLTAMGKTSPEILVALGSAAVGALAGLLAPSLTAQKSS